MDHTEDSIVVDVATRPRPKRRRRRSPDQSRSPAQEPAPAPPLSDLSTLPYQSLPPYDPAESIEMALTRFKAWMRAGAPHDPGCFTCHKPGGVDCATCRRSYHDYCRPNAMQSSLNNGHWYCHICVDRGWHANPPTLTPPASPVQSAAEVPMTTASSVPRRRRSRSPTQTSAALTSAPEISYEPERATRSRKSRYTTLPKEVDSALRVLYAELESTGELRQQVAHLTADVTRLKQELELGKKQLELEKKISQSARSLQTEVSRLRLEATQQQAAASEIATLKRDKEQTEAELKDTRAELEKMKKTLQEWRRSISNLVDAP